MVSALGGESISQIMRHFFPCTYLTDWKKKYKGDIVPEKVFEYINQYFFIPDVRKIPNKLTFSCHQKSMRTVDVGTFF